MQATSAVNLLYVQARTTLVGCVLLTFFAWTGVGSAQPCTEPPTGLVSWWPGEGNADDLIGGNHGTLRGGTTFAAGMVGQGFSLDGVDDLIQVPDAPNLDITGELSIAVWIKPNAITDDLGHVIIDKKDNTFHNDPYGFVVFHDHRLIFVTSGDSMFPASSASTIPGGRSHMPR